MGRAGISAALDRGAWLTTLVAGAGAGKTTALGAWAAEHEADWYTLGPDDAELSALLPRLIDAEGNLDNVEESKLVFRGADKPASVPDAVPAEFDPAASSAAAEGPASTSASDE